mmetsp:Transcript_32557/g.87407  ORF Transcript_32557/g.87407 Transcript_32557/m.87407 type:complete len:230 (+) Transcript_32557:279-968(+)
MASRILVAIFSQTETVRSFSSCASFKSFHICPICCTHSSTNLVFEPSSLPSSSSQVARCLKTLARGTASRVFARRTAGLLTAANAASAALAHSIQASSSLSPLSVSFSNVGIMLSSLTTMSPSASEMVEETVAFVNALRAASFVEIVFTLSCVTGTARTMSPSSAGSNSFCACSIKASTAWIRKVSSKFFVFPDTMDLSSFFAVSTAATICTSRTTVFTPSSVLPLLRA